MEVSSYFIFCYIIIILLRGEVDEAFNCHVCFRVLGFPTRIIRLWMQMCGMTFFSIGIIRQIRNSIVRCGYVTPTFYLADCAAYLPSCFNISRHALIFPWIIFYLIRLRHEIIHVWYVMVFHESLVSTVKHQSRSRNIK